MSGTDLLLSAAKRLWINPRSGYVYWEDHFQGKHVVMFENPALLIREARNAGFQGGGPLMGYQYLWHESLARASKTQEVNNESADRIPR